MIAAHTKLGEICNVRRGTTITKKQTIEGDVPVIGGGTKPTYFHNESNRKANCITISGSGASAGFVNQWGVPIFASDCSTVEPKDNTQLPKFIYYFLLSKQEYIYKNFRSGAAQPHVYAKDIGTLEYPILPLAEQQRIVAKLDTAFNEIERAIEVCKEQISANVQMKSHSLTSLFFSDDFVLRRVDEIASIKGGKRLPKGKKVTTKNTGFPYIRVSDFNDNGSVDEESVQFVEPDVQAEISRYTISSDDVYVSIAGTIGKTGIVPPSLDNANLTENAAKLVLKEGVDRDFIYFFTRTSSFEKQAIAQTRQTTQPKLALERLGVVELPIYELPQQRQIAFDAKLLSQEIAKVIKNREEKLLQLADLKSSILTQELQPQHIEAT